MALRHRYTIERLSEPASLRRYLVVLDDGEFGWAGGALPFIIFKTARAAKMFVDFRMGEHGYDAKVVRHAVH